jgi:Flp pilus assembly protein TadG
MFVNGKQFIVEFAIIMLVLVLVAFATMLGMSIIRQKASITNDI